MAGSWKKELLGVRARLCGTVGVQDSYMQMGTKKGEIQQAPETR
jgi:hypothetical protein